MEERVYLDHFFLTLGVRCDDIQRGDNPPDFIVTIKGEKISIEMTDFYSSESGPSGHTHREVTVEFEKLRDKIDLRIKEESLLKNLHIFLWFNKLLLPSSKKQDQFIKEICLFARLFFNKINSNLHFTIFDNFDGYPLLKEYLMEVRLRIGMRRTDWNYSSGFVDKNRDTHDLITSIEKKITNPPEKKLYWLLIVTGPSVSQMFGPHEVEVAQSCIKLNELLRSGPFDKIYVHQFGFGHILEGTSDGWKVNRTPCITSEFR